MNKTELLAGLLFDKAKQGSQEMDIACELYTFVKDAYGDSDVYVPWVMFEAGRLYAKQDSKRDNPIVEFLTELDYDVDGISINLLYADYKRHCEREGVKPISPARFTNEVNKICVTKTKRIGDKKAFVRE